MRKLHPRGTTLIELVIVMAVTVLILAGVVGTMKSQQQAFNRGQNLRIAQSNARGALLYIEQTLGTAGYGMDPALAFDFGWYSNSATCPTQITPCDRDKTNNPDEIVFYSRNPRYYIADDGTLGGNVWAVTSIDSAATKIYFTPRGGEKILKGQIVQVVCSPGQNTQNVQKLFYATVSTTATGSPLSLDPVITANPFKQQTAVPYNDACITSGSARMFLIDRYRFHVRPVSQGGAKYDPYLVLDRGVDLDGNGTVDQSDEQFIAEGIETIQFAYTFANAALPTVGTTSGTAITLAAGSTGSTPKLGSKTTPNEISTIPFPLTFASPKTVYDPISWYAYAMQPVAAERTTDSQANIRQVRIAIEARSPEPDPENAENFRLPVFNQNTAPTWITTYATSVGGRDGYSRVRIDSAVSVPNMLGRAQLYY